MSNIGKKLPNDGEKLEDMVVQYNESIATIRKMLNGRKDVNELRTEEKSRFAAEYLRAAQLANKIASRHTDPEKVEEYRCYAQRLSDRARIYGSSVKSKIPDTTFDDVKGLENVKKIVRSFIFIAQNPQIVKYYNIEGGLGLLMYGAPGTGKTMFAEAIANALNLPLFVVTPADIFKSYVGESEQAVRQLFEEIDSCPDGAILFVDECESIFSRRTQDTRDYKAAVTTELLQRINGFGVDGSKRMIIAATNRPDVIDPAYLRYKRFSHLVNIVPPDIPAINAIVYGKLGEIELAPGLTKEQVAAMINAPHDGYYSAADVCGIIEEACRLALEVIQDGNLKSPIPLTEDMFVRAIQKIPPSISEDLKKQYDNFRKKG